jgi:hypothetical protein
MPGVARDSITNEGIREINFVVVVAKQQPQNRPQSQSHITPDD